MKPNFNLKKDGPGEAPAPNAAPNNFSLEENFRLPKFQKTTAPVQAPQPGLSAQ
jgi:hypothetical protein